MGDDVYVGYTPGYVGSYVTHREHGGLRNRLVLPPVDRHRLVRAAGDVGLRLQLLLLLVESVACASVVACLAAGAVLPSGVGTVAVSTCRREDFRCRGGRGRRAAAPRARRRRPGGRIHDRRAFRENPASAGGIYRRWDPRSVSSHRFGVRPDARPERACGRDRSATFQPADVPPARRARVAARPQPMVWRSQRRGWTRRTGSGPRIESIATAESSGRGREPAAGSPAQRACGRQAESPPARPAAGGHAALARSVARQSERAGVTPAPVRRTRPIRGSSARARAALGAPRRCRTARGAGSRAEHAAARANSSRAGAAESRSSRARRYAGVSRPTAPARRADATGRRPRRLRWPGPGVDCASRRDARTPDGPRGPRNGSGFAASAGYTADQARTS